MRGFVDRVEGDFAVILLGEDESMQMDIPLSWLPADVREGTVLRIDIQVDQIATAQAHKDVQDLYDSLSNEP